MLHHLVACTSWTPFDANPPAAAATTQTNTNSTAATAATTGSTTVATASDIVSAAAAAVCGGCAPAAAPTVQPQAVVPALPAALSASAGAAQAPSHPPPYKSFIRRREVRIKIPSVHPDDISPGYVERLQELAAKRGVHLAGVYVRAGCIELHLDLETPWDPAHPPGDTGSDLQPEQPDHHHHHGRKRTAVTAVTVFGGAVAAQQPDGSAADPDGMALEDLLDGPAGLQEVIRALGLTPPSGYGAGALPHSPAFAPASALTSAAAAAAAGGSGAQVARPARRPRRLLQLWPRVLLLPPVKPAGRKSAEAAAEEVAAPVAEVFALLSYVDGAVDGAGCGSEMEVLPDDEPLPEVFVRGQGRYWSARLQPVSPGTVPGAGDCGSGGDGGGARAHAGSGVNLGSHGGGGCGRPCGGALFRVQLMEVPAERGVLMVEFRDRAALALGPTATLLVLHDPAVAAELQAAASADPAVSWARKLTHGSDNAFPSKAGAAVPDGNGRASARGSLEIDPWVATTPAPPGARTFPTVDDAFLLDLGAHWRNIAVVQAVEGPAVTAAAATSGAAQAAAYMQSGGSDTTTTAAAAVESDAVAVAAGEDDGGAGGGDWFGDEVGVPLAAHLLHHASACGWSATSAGLRADLASLEAAAATAASVAAAADAKAAAAAAAASAAGSGGGSRQRRHPWTLAGGLAAAAAAPEWLVRAAGVSHGSAEEEAEYLGYAAPWVFAQGHVIQAVEVMSLVALLFRARHQLLDPSNLTTLAGCAPGTLTALAWPLLPYRRWVALVNSVKVPRYLAYMTAKIMIGWFGFPAPPGIVPYQLGPAMLIMEGVLLPGSCVLSPRTALLMALLKWPASVAMMLSSEATHSMSVAVLITGRVVLLAMLTTVACHAYLRLKYERWRGAVAAAAAAARVATGGKGGKVDGQEGREREREHDCNGDGDDPGSGVAAVNPSRPGGSWKMKVA